MRFCAFLCVFVRFCAEKCEQVHKNEGLDLRFYTKTEQCERGINKEAESFFETPNGFIRTSLIFPN